GVAVAALGVGWVRAGPTPERPAPSTLVYAMERDETGLPVSARWASLEGPGSEWAAEAARAEFTDTVAMEVLGLPPRPYLGAAAPLAAVPPPEITVLSDTVVAGERRVRLGIRSTVGAEMVRLTLSEGVQFAGVDGAGAGRLTSDPFTPAVRTVEHWGRPASRLEVELTGGVGTPWTVEVVEHHLRPGEIFGDERFQRPPELMANLQAYSDRAIFRTPFRIDSGTPIVPAAEPAPGDGSGEVPPPDADGPTGS
ncbi:MAG TPA: hypothetical protein VLA43_02625, partial [Longimicrobiales bacterium]|nr:hypothetical protein [Longimicrobiales bacterium]